MNPRVVLVGAPGAGKSTIGRRLATAWDVPFCDTDAEIEELTGRTIPDIFATDGERAFRAIEEDVVAAALDSAPGVVSLGGGAVLSDRTRAALAGHTVVFLDISLREGLLRTGISGRTAEDAARPDPTRPLLAGPDPAGRYRALLEARRPLYREVATLTLRTDRRSPGRVARELVEMLERQQPGAAPAAPPKEEDRD